MTDSSIPSEWHQTNLCAVAQWGSGGTPSRKNPEYYGGDVPWVKTGDLGPKVLSAASEYITELGVKKSSAKYFPKGSVAIAMYGATIGKTSILGFDATTNQACAVGQPINGITNTTFLYYLLRNEKDAFIAKGKGGAQPNISQTLIKNHPIALPPLPEQKVIADKLDTLLAQVENTKARLERIPKILKRFRQSVLAAAVSGRLTEEWRTRNECQEFNPEAPSQSEFRGEELTELPAGWAWLRFDQVAKIASNLVDPNNYPDAIHIAPNHIESGTGVVSGYQSVKEDGVTSPKHRFFTGQILYSKIRPYLCKVSVAGFEGLCSADMYPVVAFGSRSYLFRWMLSSQFTNWASNAESRSVLPKINQKDLSKIPVPTPPEEEQTEIVRQLDQLFAHADYIEQQVNNALARVNNLTQSILAKAFRGELTEQWRKENLELISGENSAEALLARIKAERADTKPMKRARKS